MTDILHRRADDGKFWAKLKHGKEIITTGLLFLGLLGTVLAVWGDDRYASKDSTNNRIIVMERDTALVQQELRNINDQLKAMNQRFDELQRLLIDSLTKRPR